MSQFKTKKITSAKKDASSMKNANQESAIFRKRIEKYLRLTIGLILIAGTLAVGLSYAIKMAGNIKLSTNSGASLFQPLSSIFGDSGTIIATKKITGTTNILISGIGGRGHEGSELTDSLMLASLNTDEGYITLLSIPRDLFVAYPKGFSQTAGRINSLYGMGRMHGQGVNILASKIAEITGQSIDHYLIIDFAGFKQIVDTLGGIELYVPSDIIDHQYPTENWGYTTFAVKKGFQVFNGDIALKYARSRHSTSDFDRSERQQILIKAIKNKALSTGFVTSPEKMKALFQAITTNLDTDLTIGDITSLGLKLQDIDSGRINVYNLSNDCVGYRCSAGAYLYNPSREYFGGASALIPENASANKLSYYDDIRRFVSFIFKFPTMKNDKVSLNIITEKGKSSRGHELGKALQKLGFLFDIHDAYFEATGSIDTSHINIYWNQDAEIGFAPNSLIVRAFKEIEDRIPYISVQHNEYITTHGPRIEIVLGKDSDSYFDFAKTAYYLPYIESSGSLDETTSTGGGVSGELHQKNSTSLGSQNRPTPTTKKTESHQELAPAYTIEPGEWENF